MSPVETQAVEVKAAADNALLEGLTRIHEAAVAAADPVKKSLEALSVKQVQEAAKESLEAVEKNQTGYLKLALKGEMTRQENELASMQAGANMVAKLSANHVRETTEQWAENQARNYIVLSANGTMADVMQTAEKTAQIRQEATELTKGAIKSAAHSLEVAKQAQAAITMVPKETMAKAKKTAAQMKEEQEALSVEIASSESSVRKIALVAQEGYKTALATLDEANLAEVIAKDALETSRSNAGKIEKLKTRSQVVFNKAKKAKEELDKSTQ